MDADRLTPTVLIAVFLAACATAPTADHLSLAWSVDVVPADGGEAGGFGTVSELETGITRALVTLTGLAAAGEYAWRVYTGTCATLGDSVGDRAAYPDLQPSPGGNASGSATLPLRLQADVDYVIAVRAAGAVIACGALRSIEM